MKGGVRSGGLGRPRQQKGQGRFVIAKVSKNRLLFRGRYRVIGFGKTNVQAVFVLAAAAMTMIVLAGCADMGNSSVASDPSSTTPPPVDGQTVSFAAQVSPIFQHYGCYGCHGGSGGLFVTSVAQLLRGGDHGPAVVPGKADTSNLVRKLSVSAPFGDRMPQGGPYLPDSTLQVIKLWINQGAKDN